MICLLLLLKMPAGLNWEFGYEFSRFQDSSSP